MPYKYVDPDTKMVICFPCLKNECIPQETAIKNVRLASAYIPYQKMCTLLSPLNALKAGTIFPELFSPYRRKKCGLSKRAGYNQAPERKGR